MALGDTYATLDELKAYLALSDNTSLDDQLSDALLSASREIERYCNRQFNKTTTASARLYSPDTVRTLWLDDFHTITGLVIETDDSGDGVFETTWTSADYELYPVNGIVEGQPGWPFYKVCSVSGSWFPTPWPYGRASTVRVTAQWGWADVPAPVKQACLIIAAEAFQLKDAPLGVAGMGEFGFVRVRGNQMAMNKLSNYRRSRILVG